MTVLRIYGPMDEKHPDVGELCGACNVRLKIGDFTTLIALGPGASEGARERARQGKTYNAVCSHIHYACATGYTHRE